jgi:hypothetical protein
VRSATRPEIFLSDSGIDWILSNVLLYDVMYINAEDTSQMHNFLQPLSKAKYFGSWCKPDKYKTEKKIEQ